MSHQKAFKRWIDEEMNGIVDNNDIMRYFKRAGAKAKGEVGKIVALTERDARYSLIHGQYRIGA